MCTCVCVWFRPCVESWTGYKFGITTLLPLPQQPIIVCLSGPGHRRHPHLVNVPARHSSVIHRAPPDGKVRGAQNSTVVCSRDEGLGRRDYECIHACVLGGVLTCARVCDVCACV